MSTGKNGGPIIPDPAFETARALGRIEGRIEQAFSVQQDHTKRLDDHETRIDGLERGAGNIKSWAAGAAFIISGVTALAAWKLEAITGALFK